MIKKLIIIFVFLINSIGCVTNINGEQKEYSVKHYKKYSHKGTKSEARHGFLEINGKNIPDVFRYVKTNQGEYKFFQRTNMWGNDGYHPIKKSEIKIKTINGQMSEAAIKNKYYIASYKFKNTPANWIFVAWDKEKAFVSPEKLFGFIKIFNLKKISRMTNDLSNNKFKKKYLKK